MLLLGFMMLIPGPIGLASYELIQRGYPFFGLGLAAERTAIAQVVSGFAFTMLGFLAAVITILFSFTQTAAFRRYKRNGYLNLFFFCYFFTVASLVVTSFLAMGNFSNLHHGKLFLAMLANFVNNIVQIGLLTLVLCNVARSASAET